MGSFAKKVVLLIHISKLRLYISNQRLRYGYRKS